MFLFELNVIHQWRSISLPFYLLKILISTCIFYINKTFFAIRTERVLPCVDIFLVFRFLK